MARARAAAAARAPVEGPWALPDGWRWERLGDVAPVNPHRSLSHIDDDKEVVFVPMAAVSAETGRIDIRERRLARSVRQGFTRFRSGDVLFAKITPCMENGKIAIVPEIPSGIGCGSTEFHIMAPNGVSAEYLYHWVSQRSFRESAAFFMTGTAGQKRVPTDYIRQSMIPCPSGEGQRRIVARIDELFGEVEEGEAALGRARADLGVWRKALLKAAVTGELTADWRAANPSTETGADLLARILAERRARWLADPRNRGKRYIPPQQPDTANLPVVPGSWCWATMQQLSWASGYGTSEKCSATSKGTVVLRIPNIKAGRVSYGELKRTVKLLTMKEGSALAVGDLLVIRTNGSDDLIGRAGLVLEPPAEPTFFASYLIRLRLLGPPALIEWLSLLVDSPVFRAAVLRSIGSSAGQFNLNLTKIERFAVPMPPASEVIAATARFRAASLQAEHGGEFVDTVDRASITLRQSILSAAFRGELVA